MTLSSPIISDLGLPFLEIEQVIEMIGLVITLFPISVATSFYLQESLELLQLESGLDSTILEAEYPNPNRSIAFKIYMIIIIITIIENL